MCVHFSLLPHSIIEPGVKCVKLKGLVGYLTG